MFFCFFLHCAVQQLYFHPPRGKPPADHKIPSLDHLFTQSHSTLTPQALTTNPKTMMTLRKQPLIPQPHLTTQTHTHTLCMHTHTPPRSHDLKVTLCQIMLRARDREWIVAMENGNCDSQWCTFEGFEAPLSLVIASFDFLIANRMKRNLQNNPIFSHSAYFFHRTDSNAPKVL